MSSTVTVLIHLPVFYNPDRQGRRRRIGNEKFERTADEIARKFHGGGTLYLFANQEALCEECVDEPLPSEGHIHEVCASDREIAGH